MMDADLLKLDEVSEEIGHHLNATEAVVPRKD